MTSEHCQRTPDAQKGKLVSSERGKAEDKDEKGRQKDFRTGTRDHPGEGVVKDKFPYSRKPSHRRDQ